MNDRRSFEAIKPSTLDPWLVFGFLCLVPCALYLLLGFSPSFSEVLFVIGTFHHGAVRLP